MVKQLFLKYLCQFEVVLNFLGYSKIGEELKSTGNYKEGLSVVYINNQINRKIYIDYLIWDDTKDISLSMFMYKIPKNNTYFSLSDFLNNHNLNSKLKSELPASSEFEPFVKKYFEDLKSLFENELNDQITGKTFENHIDALRQSMDEY